MSTEDVILVHYGELTLKKGNRRAFEQRLVRNIKRALGAKRIIANRLYGRLILTPQQHEHEVEPILATLSRVLGIASYGRAAMADATWDGLLEATARILPEGQHSFGVRTKTADGRWPKGRTETSRDLGAWIVEQRGWPVNLSNPDLWVRVEVANGRVLVGTDNRVGSRGLPVGVSGKVLSLLSGGIDSPVATWRMMYRGCHVLGAHFHSAPYTSRASQEKVIELARILRTWQPDFRLWMVPFADLQRQIVQHTDQRWRVLLYRRFMLRVAEVIAKRNGGRALITGESLGQVASQTLANIRAVEAAADMTVLRPLVGMDKLEIMDMARRIGTYDTSIEPHDDCCSYLLPKSPATKSYPDVLAYAEEALDVEALVQATVDRIEEADLD